MWIWFAVGSCLVLVRVFCTIYFEMTGESTFGSAPYCYDKIVEK